MKLRWSILPLVPFLILNYFWRRALCSFGCHDVMGPNGYCDDCSEKVQLGRSDVVVVGVLTVWGEEGT